MSSIGPQLPPVLSKRKRDSEDDTSCPKHPRPNTDEIDLSSDEDDFGPTAPAAAPQPAVSGPTLPTNTDEIDLEASDPDSDTGPAPPPVAAASAKPTPGPASRPAAGPASRPPAQPESDSDSDDDYGPSLPSSKPQIGPSLPPSLDPSDSATEQKQQRDDWMLAPPTSSGYSERDPSNLKARKFASKPGPSAGKSDGEISSIWTETPEEKLKRLQDSVLGRSSAPQQGPSPASAAQEKKSREEEERNARISENLKSQKGRSLVEEHQERRHKKTGKKADEEDDDPSKRAFDREKDMAIGGRMGGRERREMMAQAKGFGGRFGKGSFL